MTKKKGWKTKSLKRQLKNYPNNLKMIAKIEGRIKGLKGE